MEEPRRRGLLTFSLVVLGTIAGFLAVFAIWAKRQVLETDSWVETSTELLEDGDIQQSLSTFIGDTLFESVDVAGELEARLPPQAKALAGPAAGGLRELTDRITLRALEGPRVQALWEEANRRAHEALIAIVKDEGDLVETGDGTVSVDVAAIVERVGEQAGIDAAGKVPPEVASIEILRSDELSTAQEATALLEKLALILPFVSFGLFGLAIYAAPGARRETLRSVGWAFVVVGVLVLTAQRLAGNYVVDSLAATAAAEPAAESTWEIGTSMLREGGLAVVGYGVVIVLGAWLAGPGAFARETRRELTPLLRDRRIGYGTLGALLVLIFWWNPTEGTSRIIPSLVLIALFIAGYEALRARAVRDFPSETLERARERWAARGSRLRPGGGGASHEVAIAEKRLEQLERLARLQQAGVLDDAELAAEKERILA